MFWVYLYWHFFLLKIFISCSLELFISREKYVFHLYCVLILKIIAHFLCEFLINTIWNFIMRNKKKLGVGRKIKWGRQNPERSWILVDEVIKRFACKRDKEDKSHTSSP